ncbi:peptide methionine sulfoxide reductase [Agrococcus citreus]|uniref:Peptide methionine sulfoxide reductase n=1 Tax=Agrococcus citreus TaxID=84643 RepID=A0ABN1YXA4_9MICO
MADDDLDGLVARVPLGWSRQLVDGRAWGISRTDRAGGRSSTIDGEELGGAGRMSANVWRTAAGTLLRPCEMPAEQVLEVLRALPEPG